MTIPESGRAGLVAAVINYNTAALTCACVRSLLAAGLQKVLVLDNASRPEDQARLREIEGEAVHLIASDQNLGFAGGYNRLLAETLADPACRRVFLLNSDAVAVPEGLDACLAEMTRGGHHLMGARMLKPTASGEVDSLGVTLYKCLLASNRKATGDAYLGPTGGFAIYTRELLEALQAAHGHVFDPAFFCYAEDTDLCVRARLMGFAAGYSDAVAGYHEGQGSLDTGRDDFILYHGIRNSIWMAAQSIPWRIVATHLPWIVLLHAGIVVRHTLAGRFITLAHLYFDALRGLPRVLARRRVIKASRRIAPSAFRALIDPKFYETRYLDNAVRDLYRRPARTPPA